MWNRHLLCLGLFLMLSCKAQQPTAVPQSDSTPEAATKKSTVTFPAELPDFNTVALHAQVHYQDSLQSQKVTAEVRILKDQTIWVSIRFLGFTIAKAMLTPQEVLYVDKVNSRFYKGNYALLNRLVDAEMDFQKIQRLLLGRTLIPIDATANIRLVDQNWHSQQRWGKGLFYCEWNPQGLGLSKQTVDQPQNAQRVEVQLADWDENALNPIAKFMVLQMLQAGKTSSIQIKYDQIEWNQTLTYPFSIPEGYTPITID
ncbi:MAG: hypothetical protein CFE24_07060 [Flavobacterium sp. BFFFF2]|nr:MAG: hypothetical protein CFE24_07060 [Flavobacterium sp. BFFFF2]